MAVTDARTTLRRLVDARQQTHADRGGGDLREWAMLVTRWPGNWNASTRAEAEALVEAFRILNGVN